MLLWNSCQLQCQNCVTHSKQAWYIFIYSTWCSTTILLKTYGLWFTKHTTVSYITHNALLHTKHIMYYYIQNIMHHCIQDIMHYHFIKLQRALYSHVILETKEILSQFLPKPSFGQFVLLLNASHDGVQVSTWWGAELSSVASITVQPHSFPPLLK